VILSSSRTARRRGLTLVEVMLSAFLFLLLLTAIFSLLTQSVRMLEPSSEDKLSEVVHLANNIRSDMRASDTVIVTEENVTMSGMLDGTAFSVTYSRAGEDVLRAMEPPSLGEPSKFFVSAESVRFEVVGDNLLRVNLEVLLGERLTSLRVESAFPIEKTTPLETEST
jgi:pilin/secretion family protein with methylation motif